MYKVKETIVVEGIYDKIKLSRFIDAVIIVTNGFCVFSDDRILESIKKRWMPSRRIILSRKMPNIKKSAITCIPHK